MTTAIATALKTSVAEVAKLEKANAKLEKTVAKLNAKLEKLQGKEEAAKAPKAKKAAKVTDAFEL